MTEPIWAHPEAIERDYEKALTQYARRLQRACNELLIPETSRLVDMAPRRADALESSEEPNEGTWADHLGAILAAILAATQGKRLLNLFRGMRGAASALDIGVAAYAGQVSDHNRRQAVRITRRVYGEPYSCSEPWLDDLLRAWELENLKLIRSIPERYVDDLQGVVIRAINEGQSSTALRETIRATYPQPVNRARLIANDQVGKLNARLTQYRQEAMGIKEYRWRGVLDARERPEHRRREGDVFKWSNPPYDGHPGQAIQCRCWSQAVWPPRDEVKLT